MMSKEEILNECEDVFEKEDYSLLDYLCRITLGEDDNGLGAHLDYLCRNALEEDENNLIALNYKAFRCPNRLSFPILDRILEMDPDNYFAYNTKALSYINDENYEEALKCSEKGLKIKDDEWLRRNRIEALISLERIEEAYEFYKASDIPGYTFTKGLINCGKYSQVPKFDEGLSKDELLDYYYKRCKSLYEHPKWKEYEPVLEVCEEIFKIDRDNEIALEYMVGSYAFLNQFEEVVRWCDYAIKLYPNNFRFYFDKADVLYWIYKDLDAAIESYERGFSHVECIGYHWYAVDDMVYALYEKAEELSPQEAIAIYDKILFYKPMEYKALERIDGIVKEHGLDWEWSESYRQSSILKAENDKRLKEIDDFLNEIEIGEYDEEYLKGCSQFKDNYSFKDYVREVIICLMESSYRYSEESARERVKISMNYIKGEYEVKEPAAYCVIEVGYSCG